MSELLTIAEWEAYALVFALAAAIALCLWTGRIQTPSLIYGRTNRGRRYLSAARAQLLIATLITAAHYIGEVRESAGSLPDISREWLFLVGGSQVLYLASMFVGKRKHNFHI